MSEKLCDIKMCDLHPFCQDQGCEADPTDCKRVRDLRSGAARPLSDHCLRHLDNGIECDNTDAAIKQALAAPPPRHTIAEFKIKLKGMTDEELFGQWSTEYDAKRKDFTELVIAEMNVRKLNQEAIVL